MIGGVAKQEAAEMGKSGKGMWVGVLHHEVKSQADESQNDAITHLYRGIE